MACRLVLAGAALGACGAGGENRAQESGSAQQAEPTAGVGSASLTTAPDATPVLPPGAPRVLAVDGTYTCGTASTSAFATSDVALLGDRIRVKFLPHAGVSVLGETSMARAGTVDVGAHELYLKGGANFVRRATKEVSFDGEYEPVTIMGRDGQPIITGLLNALSDIPGFETVAHGFFVDSDGDVRDVIVFARGVTAENLESCRMFGAKVISTASAGPTKLPYGTGAATETQVSASTTFSYALPADWIVTKTEGTPDLARITFRHRGVYPDGITQLQLALETRVDMWSGAEPPDATTPGTLFGLAVTWNHRKGPGQDGSWAVSTGTVRQGHAVATVLSSTTAGHRAAVSFAQTISVK